MKSFIVNIIRNEILLHPFFYFDQNICLSQQIGFVMYYVRSPCEGSQKAISMALSVIWLVAPSIQGLYFKDVKQTLRKEQCDVSCSAVSSYPSSNISPFLRAPNIF